MQSVKGKPHKAPKHVWSLLYYIKLDTDIEKTLFQDISKIRRKVRKVGTLLNSSDVVVHATVIIESRTYEKCVIMMNSAGLYETYRHDLNLSKKQTLEWVLRSLVPRADHYGIYLSGHGSGWVTMYYHDTMEMEHLHVSDIAQAMKKFIYLDGQGQIDFICFDTCKTLLGPCPSQREIHSLWVQGGVLSQG